MLSRPTVKEGTTILKKLIAFSAVIALAGCSQDAAEAPATEEAIVADTAAEKAVESTYDVTEDGETTTMTRYEDGTFAYGDATGTYRAEDEMTCYTVDGDDGGETCWGARVENEDGTMTSTSTDGRVVTLSGAPT